MLEAAEARVIVAEDQEQVDKVLEVRDRLPGLEYVVYYDCAWACAATKPPA